MKDNSLTDKNGQLVTRAKSKRADSANLKGIATNKTYRSLTVLCFEMSASSQPETVNKPSSQKITGNDRGALLIPKSKRINETNNFELVTWLVIK